MAKAYIIGPTLGMNRLNIDAFRAMAGKLEKMGHDPIVPHDLFNDEDNEPGGLTIDEAITRRVAELQNCDLAVMMPGFMIDRIAMQEMTHARAFGLQVVKYEDLYKLEEWIQQ